MTLLAITRGDVADYVGTLILVYTILMIVWVILSWIPRVPYHPVLSAIIGFVNDVVNPYVGLFRRFIPPLKMGPGALDLSPIVAFLVLYIVGGIVVGLIRADPVTRAQGWARAAVTVLAVVAVDQAGKLLADGRIARGDSINVFFGLDLTNTRNRGVAFGFLEGKGGVVGALIAVALLALVVWFALNAARAWLWLPVGLLLGGAIGNLIDRAREGAVIDFIDPIAWPAFNVADMCIVIGVLAMLYVMEGPARREA